MSTTAITIADVAKAADVSPATVSRVLNGTREVSPDRAARVRNVVAELGYQPFGPARALRRQATDLWAVVVADIENPFFTSIVRGIEDGGREHGYRVVLCNSDEDLRKEAGYIDVAIGERMAGVVIAVASTRASRLEPLRDAGIPVVAVDRRPSGRTIDCVLVDNERGAAEATRHLVERGAHRIACITGPPRLSTATEQLSGYRNALRQAGRTPDPSLVVRTDFRETGGYKAMRELCALSDPPDAVLVANNLMTVGALEALRDHGRAVPRDVRVVGFDDAPWAKLLQPSLTVVAQPTYEIGRRSAELLVSARTDPARPRQEILLSPHLIVREST
ncbi:MAG TPA: LacI family DNA-binding transcriptional regulator [Acidimicrobiales bacterium]|nr:LacI family DNA-binding transcriptional regulator [Acidimicrobiales bacterium]